MKILAADIGGTNSRFAFFTADKASAPSLVETKWIATKEVNSFAELLEQLGRSGFSLNKEEADICVFAVAGPVSQGVQANLTWVPWKIDLRNSEKDFGIRHFALINDFMAQAAACPSPIGQAAEQVLRGNAVSGAAIAVVGAGTGLGQGLLVQTTGNRFITVPSEGGHVSFAAESDREFEFQKFVKYKLGGDYVTWEDTICGRGLSYLHEFLTGKIVTPAEVAATFDLDSETLLWAATFYGRVCRNVALQFLAQGGVYVAGGIVAKNPILVKHPAFAEAFSSSRTHAELLAEIPVFLIDHEESGLWGAAYYGWNELRKN